MTLSEQEIQSIEQKYLGKPSASTATTPRVATRRERLAQPTTINALNDVPVLGQLSNVGIGIGSAVGKTVLGLGEAAMRATSGLGKLVGADTQYADKYAEGISKFKDNLYQKPFEKSLDTTSGKIGEFVGNTAPYLATAGVVNPATANLPRFMQILARTAPDLVIAAGQSGGDTKTIAGTGVTSAVANTLLPGSASATKLFSKEGAKQFGKEVAPGYVSDVAMGLSGQRGEDREGAKAFIPGFGTATAGALGVASRAFPAIVDAVKNIKNPNPEKVALTRKTELEKIVNKYPSLKTAVEKGNERGVDLIDMASKSSLLDGAVDETGSLLIRGEDGAIAKLNKELEPFENIVYDNLVREGNKVKLSDVKKYINKEVSSSGLMGDALIQAEQKAKRDIAGYSRLADKDGYIQVSDVHKAKVDKYANINYENEATKKADKTIARGLKKIVEDNTSSVDVKEINDKLSGIYAFQNFLEKLDNKKVQGGKLGTYFAQVTGGIAGSHFGPFGTIIGAELAGKIKGMSMANKFSGTTGQSIEVPEIIKDAANTAKQPRPQLGAPKEGAPRSSVGSGAPIIPQYRPIDEAQAPSANPDYSSKSLGTRNTIQSSITNPDKNVMSNSVLQTMDAVNEGLKDPTLKALYDDAPEEFVDEIKDFIVNQSGLVADDVEAKVISSIPSDIGFTGFYNTIKKLLGGDLPNKQGGFVNTASKVAPYKETGEVSTKLLKDLEGRDTVSKKYIEQRIVSGDLNLKQTEKDLAREVLSRFKDEKITASEFADAMKSELLPLKAKNVGSNYENITLPDDIRGNIKDYNVNVYESPIKTSAGDVHFSDVTDAMGQSDVENYFGHTRIEDMADNKTRRVIEVQSDLYQKGNLEKEFDRAGRIDGSMANKPLSTELAQESLDKYQTALNRWREGKRKMSELSDDPYFYADSEEMLVKRVDDWKKLLAEAKSGKIDARKAELSKLQQYNNPTAHFRMVREEIKKAAQDGKTKLQFPTGETAMKIEGLGQTNRWFADAGSNSARDDFALTPENLKLGQQVYSQGDINTSNSFWIITDVLGDGKFKAVPKDSYEKWSNYPVKPENLHGKTLEEARNELIESRKETFDISGKVDTNNPIYRFYEKDLGKYLTSKYNAKIVTDSSGVKWYQVDVNPKWKDEAVDAFGKIKINPLLIGAGTGLGIAAGAKIMENKNKENND